MEGGRRSTGPPQPVHPIPFISRRIQRCVSSRSVSISWHNYGTICKINGKSDLCPGDNLMTEEFEGTVESVIFYSPDSGYTVCRFSLSAQETIVIVGTFPPLSPGETLKVQGKWEINPRFGKQFKVNKITPIWPSTVRGVEKFLSSGLIKGIGPHLAGRIVRRFGADTLKILDEKPNRISGVEGIGPVKLREIKRSWTEHRQISDLIIFLQGHGVSTNLATKIYQQYGDRSFHVLKTNPYQACYDIWGVGFKTADQMALKPISSIYWKRITKRGMFSPSRRFFRLSVTRNLGWKPRGWRRHSRTSAFRIG